MRATLKKYTHSQIIQKFQKFPHPHPQPKSKDGDCWSELTTSIVTLIWTGWRPGSIRGRPKL
ncbi:hypothetical protein JB92DRAFT_3032255 [Gautieria morchelliformis]|nr:hypothetical protein JB92DRAFT_3032255 [Gautieria morchelliformis]